MNVASTLRAWAASMAHRAGLPGIGASLGMSRPRGYRPSRADALHYVGAETVERCEVATIARAEAKRTRRGLRGAR